MGELILTLVFAGVGYYFWGIPGAIAVVCLGWVSIYLMDRFIPEPPCEKCGSREVVYRVSSTEPLASYTEEQILCASCGDLQGVLVLDDGH